MTLSDRQAQQCSLREKKIKDNKLRRWRQQGSGEQRFFLGTEEQPRWAVQGPPGVGMSPPGQATRPLLPLVLLPTIRWSRVACQHPCHSDLFNAKVTLITRLFNSGA